MKIKSYKELIAYQKGYELAKLVYGVTARFPKEEMYGLTAQMRRSAVSTLRNGRISVQQYVNSSL